MSLRNDPRITTYLLNEMDGEERKAFEEELSNSPELKLGLSEVKKSLELIDSHIAKEVRSDLSPESVDKISNIPKKKNWKTLLPIGIALSFASFATFMTLKNDEVSKTNTSSQMKNSIELDDGNSKVVMANNKTITKPTSEAKDIVQKNHNHAHALEIVKPITTEVGKKSDNLFGNISRRYQNVSGSNVQNDQTDKFLPTSEISEVYSSLSKCNREDSINGLLQSFNYENESEIDYELSSSPFNKASLILRVVYTNEGNDIRKLNIKFNKSIVKSFRAIGQRANPFSRRQKDITKSDTSTSKGDQVVIVFELNLSSEFKTNLEGLKRKRKSSPGDEDEYFLASISNNGESLKIEPDTKDYQDSSEDHQWVLGVAASYYKIHNHSAYSLEKDEVIRLLERGLGKDSEQLREKYLSEIR